MKDVVVTERFRETMEYLSSVRAKARAMMDEADRRSMDAFFDGHAAVEVVLPRTNVRWITLDVIAHLTADVMDTKGFRGHESIFFGLDLGRPWETGKVVGNAEAIK